jgi:hypothetical protein
LVLILTFSLADLMQPCSPDSVRDYTKQENSLLLRVLISVMCECNAMPALLSEEAGPAAVIAATEGGVLRKPRHGATRRFRSRPRCRSTESRSMHPQRHQPCVPLLPRRQLHPVLPHHDAALG